MKAKGWKDVPRGGLILEPGSTVTYETGSWRNQRPKYLLDKCIHCFICWILCPEGSITVKDGKMTGIDLTYCKGCGICATECPKEAVEMEVEATA